MKLIYIIIAIVLLIDISFLSFDYLKAPKNRDLIQKNRSAKVLENYLELNSSLYIFKSKAWGIEIPKSKKKIEDKDPNRVEPFVLNEKSYPLKLCSGQRCFEFIAIKNNSVLFYGSENNGTERFFKLDVNQTLDKRLQLKSIGIKDIKMVDLLFQKEIDIKMFDINVTKYTIDTEKEENDEKSKK